MIFDSPHLLTLQSYFVDFLKPFCNRFLFHISDDEIKQAEEKFAESLHLAQMGMFNLFENEVEQVSQLCTFADALLEYHEQCVEILKVMTETLHEK